MFIVKILIGQCNAWQRAGRYLKLTKTDGTEEGRLVTKQAFYVTKFNPFFLRPSSTSICPP